MALLHIRIDQIDEARLLALIASGAAESRSIEYKRTTYGSTNADYSEFLADISSFANTSGGDLVLGMDAANGTPTTIAPLTDPIDPEKLRLEQCARGGLQPRIPNIEFHPVSITAGGNVLIIRIPRSFNPPHRVVRQGGARFYARSSAGKYEPDVNELRSLFNAGPQLADRVRNFRLDRIAKIVAGRAPVQLMDRGTVVLHIVPLSAFDDPPVLPLRQIELDFNIFAPMGSRSALNARINFDGVLKTSNADQKATHQRAYVQLFRNGIVETTDSTIVAEGSGTPIISHLDDSIVQEVRRSMSDLAAVGVEPPYALLVSLVGINGAQFNFARDPHGIRWYDSLGNRLDRDQYHFDEVLFETIPTTLEECAGIIRPILDQMANAGGQATSPIFDAQGRYIPRGG